MTDFNLINEYMINNEYLTPREIMYGAKAGFMIGRHEYDKFLKFKAKLVDESKGDFRFVVTDLASFDGNPIYFVLCNEIASLLDAITSLAIDDYSSTGGISTVRNGRSVLISRIYSEIEGTLSIESIPTTRKRVEMLYSGKIRPESKNDQIVKNMIEGIRFVFSKPDFNQENLHRLYELLSRDSLDDYHKLKDGDLYRYDGVEVDKYAGCPPEKIRECMDSLFSYVNKNIKGDISPILRFTLPYIAHYYIVYIHPYFDFNGRTARMVSLWLSLLLNTMPMSLDSEAIDQTKNKYYEALINSRDSNNDITYLIAYLLKESIDYYACYKNIEEIDRRLKQRGIVLTETEKSYFKKILISNNGKFMYKDFAKWIKASIGDQALLKILNELEGYGLLRSVQSKNNKLFYVNEEMIAYSLGKHKR